MTKTKKIRNHLNNNKHIQTLAVKAGEVGFIYSVTINDKIVVAIANTIVNMKLKILTI